MKYHLITTFVVILTAFVIGACAPTVNQTATSKVVTKAGGAELANPASQNCLDLGGELTIEQRSDGGEFGVCIFEQDTIILLEASPDSGSEFKAWSGDCSGSGDCEITMDPAKGVTAIFEALHKISLPIAFC